MTVISVYLALALSAVAVLASPFESIEARAAADNTVKINSASKFCMIMPRKAHTDIGDSEHPGGMRSYCSASAKTSSLQGTLPSNFWKNVAYKKGTGKKGNAYVQLTGCINAKGFSQLNAKDGGGQYDSSGGAGGKGNPKNSVCTGYNHYVEIVEPGDNRACIRCCKDAVDCPTNKDTSGCPAVIPGKYFSCS